MHGEIRGVKQALTGAVVGLVSVAPPGMALLTLQRWAALRLPGLRWARCGLKASPSGRHLRAATAAFFRFIERHIGGLEPGAIVLHAGSERRKADADLQRQVRSAG